jgi:hypothetical protein
MNDPSESTDEQFDKEEDLNVTPDASLTGELFLEWRAPRRGQANPEQMNNPVWEWLIRSKWSAFRAKEHFKGESACQFGPGWCFQRFGQSSTRLPDGRIVQIAGEHEDFYDPDFFIYNDVVIRHPGGAIDIFGYPTDIFPPTDFHTATLTGNRIIIIGSLGYADQRHPETGTPVFVLDLDSFRISHAQTSGQSPGWIHLQTATLTSDGRAILIERGNLELVDGSHVENIDDWLLHLDDFRWERLTQRQWERWQLSRRDEEDLHLFKFRAATWMQRLSRHPEQFEEYITGLERELGCPPDLAIFQLLYLPDVPHEAMPGVEKEFNVHRITIDGVIVRYMERSDSILLTVEGDLPGSIVDTLRADLCRKLSALENTPCEWKQL